MDNTNENNNTSRRDFLKMAFAIGAGTVTGGIAIYTGINYESKKAPNSKIKVLTTEGEVVEVDKQYITPAEKEELFDLQQSRGRQGIKGRKWVMVIDLSKCRNARMCMAACQGAHHLRPEQHHINVLRMQDAEYTAPYFMPKPCYHCDNPPCTKVCPVDATFKRSDGIVLIDNERCIGCRFCVAACPYSARVFHWFNPQDAEKDKELVYDIELNVPQKRGTITKCLFSADRLRKNELPYCVSACPNGVYYFGDMNEDAVTNGLTKETVRFSDLIRENAGYTVMEELGTKPSVYYLPPKERLFPFQFEGKTTLDEKHG